MKFRRGDVVLVDYPYTSGGQTKVRPVLIVNVLTLDKKSILRQLGMLPDTVMRRIDNCLKNAPALS